MKLTPLTTQERADFLKRHRAIREARGQRPAVTQRDLNEGTSAWRLALAKLRMKLIETTL